MELRRKKGVYTVLAFFGVFGKLVVWGEDIRFIPLDGVDGPDMLTTEAMG